MVIGFATFSANLNINGTSSIESNWSVVFTNIQEVSKTSGVTINSNPTASGTTATFDVDLQKPGDSIEYQITVENQGTLDAIIENIETTETENSALIFEVSGIKEGSLLEAKQTAILTVTVKYNNVTEQPDDLTADLEVTLDYSQAPDGVGGTYPSGA